MPFFGHIVMNYSYFLITRNNRIWHYLLQGPIDWFYKKTLQIFKMQILYRTLYVSLCFITQAYSILFDVLSTLICWSF